MLYRLPESERVCSGICTDIYRTIITKKLFNLLSYTFRLHNRKFQKRLKSLFYLHIQRKKNFSFFPEKRPDIFLLKNKILRIRHYIIREIHTRNSFPIMYINTSRESTPQRNHQDLSLKIKAYRPSLKLILYALQFYIRFICPIT